MFFISVHSKGVMGAGELYEGNRAGWTDLEGGVRSTARRGRIMNEAALEDRADLTKPL